MKDNQSLVCDLLRRPHSSRVIFQNIKQSISSTNFKKKLNMKYKTKSLLEIKEACVIQEALILNLLSLLSEGLIDTASINNDYGVLKSRLMYALKHYKKSTVKRDATPDEIAYYFSMASDIYPELKVPIRGKIDTFFIETLEVALKLTRKYLLKIERAKA